MEYGSLFDEESLSSLRQYKRLIVGFSGGLDSTVLLHALASMPEFQPKLKAVHVNHGISTNAASWQQHALNFCQQFNIPFFTETVTIDCSANIEERARIARYEVFKSLLNVGDALLVGHHQDDQAETLLLQLFRGAGVDGLAAMSSRVSCGVGDLLRPLLQHSRSQLEQYACAHHLSWVDDESNQDLHYSRNFLRQQILPQLKEKWPGLVSNIARTALHCQQAKHNLDVLAHHDFAFPLNHNTLFYEPLLSLDAARASNVLRIWLKNNNIPFPSTLVFKRLIDELIHARHDAAPEVNWGHTIIRRYQAHLYLDKKIQSELPSSIIWKNFPERLVIVEDEFYLQVQSSMFGIVIPPDATIEVRFRQGGEEFIWHGQRKSLKKLFQQWGIPPWLRQRIPLIFVNRQLAVVVGYAVSDLFFSDNPEDALTIITSPVF